ncbi:MAG: hypothetical protein E6Q95_03145 [Chitinophagaceae bacterium]|nr:MAG: hypothetical protein E6Q95_03145 [Chitinophagaceae bacterium]
MPPSYMGNNNQNAYNMSILDMSQRVSAIYTNGAFDTDYNINSYIKVRKVKFGPDNLRMMIIQPIYSPTVKKRCVLMSPGNDGAFGSWYTTNRYAIDFALRGYIVAYYENSGSVNPNLNGTSYNTRDYFINKVNSCMVAPYNTNKDKFFTSMFINLFISDAARKYVVSNSTSLKIDTTGLFLAGGSLGANTALFFGYGSNNNWSTNTYFNCVKNMLNYPGNISNNGVRCILSIGGGLPAPTEALGNIINSSDNIPSIHFSGAGDPVAHPNKSNILGPEIWGPLAYKSVYETNNIKHNVYLNCYGIHAFEAPSYDDIFTGLWYNSLPSNTISGNTNPPYNNTLTYTQVNNYVLSHLQNLSYYQYTEFQSYQALSTTANYFVAIINNSIPIDVLNYIRPTQLNNSPFYKYSIGQYTLEQAVLGYYSCESNQPICIFSGAHEYDNTAKNNINSTFIASDVCDILPDNYASVSYSLINENTTATSRIADINIEKNVSELTNIFEINIDKDENLIFTFTNELHSKECNINIFNILGERLYSKNIISIENVVENQIHLKDYLNNIPTGILICQVNIGGINKSIKFFHKTN